MKNTKTLAALFLAMVMAFSVMVMPAMAKEEENAGIASDIMPRNMPVSYCYECLLNVYSNPIAYANFVVSCTGTVNVQNSDVITANAEIIHNRSANLDTYSLNVRTSKSGSQVTVYITGTVDFKYTEPSTGLTLRATERVNTSFVFDPNDYIN